MLILSVIVFAQVAPAASASGDLWGVLNQVGTVGLAFIVLALMMGWFITRREFDALKVLCAEYKQERDEERAINRRASGVVADAVDLAKQRRP